MPFYKKISLSVLFLSVFSLVTLFASAQVNSIKEVNCWDYYKFYDNSYQINNFQIEKDSFNPGEMIFYSGSFKNGSNLVIPQTKVMIQTWYFDNNVEYMLDESIIDIGQVEVGEEKAIKGAYVVPQGAPSGKYLLEAYVLQNHYYLSGTGFLRGTPGARAGFTVNSNNKPVFFRGDKILYDQTLIGLHSPVTDRIFSQTENIVFRSYLKNDTTSSSKVNVTQELFYWDGLKEFKIKDVKNAESVNVVSKTEKEVKTDLGKLGPGTYVLKLTATNSGAKTILNIRFLVQGVKARIWYSNVLGGTVKKGTNTAIVCIGNMAPITQTPNFINSTSTIASSTAKNETVKISVNSLDGSEKSTISQSFELAQESIKGYLIDFILSEDLNNFNLVTKLSESDFNQETLTFKSSVVSTPKTDGETLVGSKTSPSKNIIFYFGLLFLLILIIISIWHKKFQK